LALQKVALRCRLAARLPLLQQVAGAIRCTTVQPNAMVLCMHIDRLQRRAQGVAHIGCHAQAPILGLLQGRHHFFGVHGLHLLVFVVMCWIMVEYFYLEKKKINT
jgi:hypothetical protein